MVVEKDIFLIGGHDMSRDVYVYDTTNPTTAPAQISSSLPSKKTTTCNSEKAVVYPLGGVSAHACCLLDSPTLGGYGILCAGGIDAQSLVDNTCPVSFLPLDKNPDGSWKPWQALPRIGDYVRKLVCVTMFLEHLVFLP